MISKVLRALRLRRRYVYRDAVSGVFVSKEYAEKHPETTVRERVL